MCEKNPQLARGFMLIEVALVVVLVGVLLAVAFPVYNIFSVKNDLDLTGNATLHMLRRAQTHAHASDGDLSWGVRIASTTVTLFQGSSYASRVSASDDILDIPATITPSGLGEVVFGKLLGEPNVTGTIIFTSVANRQVTITVNGKGMAGLIAGDIVAPPASQSDSLVINTSNASIGGPSSRDLLGITIENIGTSPITIDRITVTWDSTRRIEDIIIGGTTVWSFTGVGTPTGRQPSGTVLDIVNYTLPASSGSISINRFRFNGGMTGRTFSITFTMTDGSTKTVGGIMP